MPKAAHGGVKDILRGYIQDQDRPETNRINKFIDYALDGLEK